ncbi:hypothetical protein [Streptomyces sp. NPDC101115]
MTWWQWLAAYLTAPFALLALWIALCEITRARHRRQNRSTR